MFLLCLGSCAPAPPDTNPQIDANSDTSAGMSDPPPELVAEIRSLTDDVLLALASHNYRQLKTFLAPNDPEQTGTQAAALLLGRHWSSLVLDRWDAQNIEIQIEENISHAHARVDVFYRNAPNRKRRQGVFLFHFQRKQPQNPWRLLLP